MNSISLTLVLISGILIIVLPRKLALCILLFSVTLIPMSAFTIGPASFYPVRILIFFGIIRTIFRGERLPGSLNKTDKVVILWALVMIFTRLVTPRLDTSVIARFGETYDIIGIYFLFRFLLRDMNDIQVVFKSVIGIFCVLALFMFYEKATQHNLFSTLGGVPPWPQSRDGRIRCQGPFAHSILAGTVAATSTAWFIAMYLQGGKLKVWGCIGFFASAVIVFLSSSSGPIMSLFLIIVGFIAWPLRNNMQSVRRWIFITLVLLHFIMEAPVWYLISKIDLTGSSTGWHRSELIDQAIRHFNDWWLSGVDYTRHWMPTGVTWSDRHSDITNQYIKTGVDGGFAAVMLFIWMIVSSFSIAGKTITNTTKNRILVWSLGCTLFSHTITFLSVRYFDQSFTYFYLTLAMLGSTYGYMHIQKPELIESFTKGGGSA